MHTNAFEIHRAVVASSDSANGKVGVRIPGLFPAGDVISVPSTGLTQVNGVWSVPSVGSTVFVAVSPDRTQFLWLTAIDNSLNSDLADVLGLSTYASAQQLGSDIDGEAADDESGYSVSLSSDGTTVAIGAVVNDGTASSAGHVRVYEWSGSSWVQKGADIDGEAASDFSGYSVSLSYDGTIVAIGAPFNDGNGSNSGHVRVYEWNGSGWVQKGSDIDGEAGGDSSGVSVSLSNDGTRLAVGAYGNDGTASSAGHVRVYAWNGSAWVQQGSDIDGEAAYDRSGFSVSLSSDGMRVAVGAYFNDGNGVDSGHVRVYEWSGSSWVQLGSDIDGEAGGDYSGWSVSLSYDGTHLAIGAIYNDGNGLSAGHVRVYEWDGSAWVQKGSDIDGEAAGDISGFSVSLSSDGTTVAIGARANDGNGADSGHVRVYSWSGSSWVQLVPDIDGEAANDVSGWSVSLSADGMRVAVGAYLNDGNGVDSGHVRVFEVKRVGDISVSGINAYQNLDVYGDIYKKGVSIDRLPPTDLLSSTNLYPHHAGTWLAVAGTGTTYIRIIPNSLSEFPLGTQILISRSSTGAVYILPETGVTLRSTLGTGIRSIANVSGFVTLIKYKTDEWYIMGDVA